MYFVAKELVCTPGLPVTEKGVRQALSRYARGDAALVRRRKGTKAFEFHIDCLPDEVREVVQARMAHQVMKTSDNAGIPVNSSKSDKARQPGNELLTLYRNCPALMDNRLRELTSDQKKIADVGMGAARDQ